MLAVSKNFFNKSESAIVCPITDQASKDPLHIQIATNELEGYVLCEHMKLLDLRVRGYKKVSEIPMKELINITDAIQSIFDYY